MATGLEGQRLGDYRLTQLLGSGYYGDVYLAEHVHLETRAAVKVHKTQDIAEFLQEARIVAHLEHPHIVKVLGFSVARNETLPFLVMEYAPRGSLRRRHARGEQLPLEIVVSYVNQMAGALQYAHDRQVIHRDVKPANILISSSGELLLSDFGLAVKTLSASSSKIQIPNGTLPYMAPEQFDGQAVRASDQYSLAIMVYEWLSGDVPFRGNSATIENQQRHTPPPSLQRIVPSLPSAVEIVVLRALSKKPEQRFPSVQDFANALKQAAETPSSPGILTLRPEDATQNDTMAISTPQLQLQLHNTVSLTYSLAMQYMPVKNNVQTAHVLLVVHVTPSGERFSRALAMPRLHLCILIDHSNHVKGGPLITAKEAAKELIDSLEPTDYVSVVAYSDVSRVIIASAPAKNKPSIRAAIERIPGVGSARLSSGLEQALRELSSQTLFTAKRGIVLLTNGNTFRDEMRCVQLAQDAKAAGVTVYPIAVGQNWNKQMLDALGLANGGPQTTFLQFSSDIMNVIPQLRSDMVVTRNTALTLHLPINVAVKRIIKTLPYRNEVDLSRLSRQDSRRIPIVLGHLKKGQPHEVLVELSLPPRGKGQFRMMRAELSYDIPAVDIEHEQMMQDIVTTFTTDVQKCTINTDVIDKL